MSSAFIRESVILLQSLNYHFIKKKKSFTLPERAIGRAHIYTQTVTMVFPYRSCYSSGNESRSGPILVCKLDLAFIRLADTEDHCQTRIARTMASTYRVDRAKITTIARASYRSPFIYFFFYLFFFSRS